MKYNLLIKGISMIAVLGVMVFWGCSQDEDTEELITWNKRTVKKSLSNRVFICQKEYSFEGTIYYDNINLTKAIFARYEYGLKVYLDTLKQEYIYDTGFITPPNNPPLTGEYVEVYPGPTWYNIEIHLRMYWDGKLIGIDQYDTLPHE